MFFLEERQLNLVLSRAHIIFVADTISGDMPVAFWLKYCRFFLKIRQQKKDHIDNEIFCSNEISLSVKLKTIQ